MATRKKPEKTIEEIQRASIEGLDNIGLKVELDVAANDYDIASKAHSDAMAVTLRTGEVLDQARVRFFLIRTEYYKRLLVVGDGNALIEAGGFADGRRLKHHKA